MAGSSASSAQLSEYALLGGVGRGVATPAEVRPHLQEEVLSDCTARFVPFPWRSQSCAVCCPASESCGFILSNFSVVYSRRDSLVTPSSLEAEDPYLTYLYLIPSTSSSKRTSLVI